MGTGEILQSQKTAWQGAGMTVHTEVLECHLLIKTECNVEILLTYLRH